MAGGRIEIPREPLPPSRGGFINLQKGQAALQSLHDDYLAVVMELGDGAPVPQITPGFVTIPRPRKVALTEWEGREPLRISFTGMLDGFRFREHARIARDIRTLEKLAGHRSGNQPPHELLFDTAGVVEHDFRHAPHIRWGVEAIDWGEAIKDRRGRTLRRFVDLTLLQLNEDEELAGLPAIQKKAKERSRAWVDVRDGDTLRKIAARHGVMRSEMADFKRINKVRDADKVLTRDRVKLPPRGGRIVGG